MSNRVGELEPVGRDAEDLEIRAEIDDALAATGRFGPAYEILHQAVSGSRINFLLQVEDRLTSSTTPVWCRATHRAIDDAFGARFTLAREAAIVDQLVAHSISVPETFGASASGRALIQQALDEETDPGPDERAIQIVTYLTALDRVHDLPAAEIGPAGEVPPGLTAPDAVIAEQTAWWELAAELSASAATVDTIETASGLDDIRSRLLRIHRHLVDTPVPSIGSGLDFVHGDAGRANYVVDRAGALWIIDWELAHAGSRLEDYAWIELRGLEQDEAVWQREVIARLDRMGPDAVKQYSYFRSSIYLRSVIAIAGRIAANPKHSFVPYLTHRFRENERLGWWSAGEPVPDGPNAGLRFDAWHRWTRSLAETMGEP